MKAVVYYEYGSPDVLQLKEIEKPAVRSDGVLVRVRGAAANPYDWHFIRGEPYPMRLMFGLRAPKRHALGVDFAGVVEEVGQEVTGFKPGDEVYGMCDGAFAEYLWAPESEIALKPKSLGFGLAAAVPLHGQAARRGRGPRLHATGLRRRRREVRRDLPVGRNGLPVPLPARADAAGQVGPEQRRLGRRVDRPDGSHSQGGGAVALCEPEAGRAKRQAQPGRP